jgi:hypothetical protein
MREFSGNVLEKHGMQELLRNIWEKRQFQEVYLLRPVKCPRPYRGTLFPHRKMYKSRVSGGINVPASTWYFPSSEGLFSRGKLRLAHFLLQCRESLYGGVL